MTVPKRSSLQGSPDPELEEGLEEQEFYEEVVVDAKGFITDKKFVVVAQNNEGKKYIQVPSRRKGMEEDMAYLRVRRAGNSVPKPKKPS
ncbi:hypothetical protein JTB14_025931 [Gonioctena quinquepunctata]|nr:hypothetical protein JTB14_025931 [Gonioctena quinquepunctata]